MKQQKLKKTAYEISRLMPDTWIGDAVKIQELLFEPEFYAQITQKADSGVQEAVRALNAIREAGLAVQRVARGICADNFENLQTSSYAKIPIIERPGS